MNREDKIAMCKAYNLACPGSERAEFLASLTDDPAPTAPVDVQDSRAVVQTPTGPLDVAMVRHMVDRLRTRNSPVCANIIEALLDTVLSAKAQPGESSAEVESAPTLPGDPQALVVADRCDALAKREEWNECEDAIERALTEAAAILRRAPKREDVPGSPRAVELARDLHGLGIFLLGREVPKGWETASQKVDEAAAILRRAPGPDLDALERAMREGSSIGNRCIDRLEAAIAEMRREAGGGT